MEHPKLQELIAELVKKGKAVVFSSWNEDLRIAINTLDKKGKPFQVAERFTPAEQEKFLMHELVEIVQRKLDEQG